MTRLDDHFAVLNHWIKICTILFLVSFSFGAKSITISGFIRDASNGEALIGANIYMKHIETGAVSNGYGFYSISIPSADSIEIVYSYMGYTPQIKKMATRTSVKLDIYLNSAVLSLGTVEVTAGSRSKNVTDNQMGVVDVPIHAIREAPNILGEADILKVVQLLPGVQSGIEGTTGFYVRGGNTDQNLVLLDEAVIYNPNHMFGLISTFNSRAVNKITLIKGGFPAQYGGRLSSSMDISMREGNNREYKTEAGLGLISSKLTVEGPIIKDRASFIVSGRRTNFTSTQGPFMAWLLRPFPTFNNANYSFYDINAKVNVELTDRDRVFFSYFGGYDNAAYVDANSLNYDLKFRNNTRTLRWNHIFSDKLFTKTSLVYNSYLFSLSTLQGNFFSKFYSSIEDVNAKIDFDK